MGQFRGEFDGLGQALEGDKTTTGAICHGYDPHLTVDGLNIVLVGDKTGVCPRCNQIGIITTGAFAEYNFRKVAVHGSIVKCGCPDGTNTIIAPLNYKSPPIKWTESIVQAKKANAEQVKEVHSTLNQPVATPANSTASKVYAKSITKPLGNTDAGEQEEPHNNFGYIGYYLPKPVNVNKPVPQNVPSQENETSDLPWYKQLFTSRDKKSETVATASVMAVTAESEPMTLLFPAAGGLETVGTFFVESVGATLGGIAVMGLFAPTRLNENEPDLLTPEMLSQLAKNKGKAPSRLRMNWAVSDDGRLKPQAYHVAPESGLDQVKVRELWYNCIKERYEFWEDGIMGPTILWTPDKLDFEQPIHTGTPSDVFLSKNILVNPLPEKTETQPTITPAPQEKDFRDYILVHPTGAFDPIYIYLHEKYHTPPKGNPPLPAFPDAKYSRSKTMNKGGKQRARWKDSEGKIYEWDSQHGTVELYDKSGRSHLGEFDPVTGKQTKPADPTRRVEK